MNLSKSALLMSLLLLGLAFGSTGCEKEGPAEQAGQTIDRTVEKTGDRMENIKDAATE
ncbi:transport-associated protein [Thiocapsa imhoffii]|uniref:Transport-associated protein n=1 Tax=Thiocapsa imhoffii TaxID=382777 RepID=A0A9X0WK19_9GAMM|nr:transport-associated protein [Thiocapsa imhoffii]